VYIVASKSQNFTVRIEKSRIQKTTYVIRYRHLLHAAKPLFKAICNVHDHVANTCIGLHQANKLISKYFHVGLLTATTISTLCSNLWYAHYFFFDATITWWI